MPSGWLLLHQGERDAVFLSVLHCSAKIPRSHVVVPVEREFLVTPALPFCLSPPPPHGSLTQPHASTEETIETIPDDYLFMLLLEP